MWGRIKFQRQFEADTDLAQHYQSLPKCGLKITALLGHAYHPAIDGAIHLDSLLARAVSQQSQWEPEFGPLPIPLEVLWVSPDGIPLWAATDMMPDGPSFSCFEYWHKKFPVTGMLQWAAKPNTPTTRGPFKEYRIPMHLRATASLSAFCIGNAERITELLAEIPSVGKKPAQGKGSVVHWEVTEANIDESFILDCRPVPVRALASAVDKRVSPSGGWSPPYWYAPWHEPIALSAAHPTT